LISPAQDWTRKASDRKSGSTGAGGAVASFVVKMEQAGRPGERRDAQEVRHGQEAALAQEWSELPDRDGERDQVESRQAPSGKHAAIE
jgi:hypothetical protein